MKKVAMKVAMWKGKHDWLIDYQKKRANFLISVKFFYLLTSYKIVQMQSFYRRRRKRQGRDPAVEAPSWLAGDLRDLSLRHSRNQFDASHYSNQKKLILEEAYEDMTSPHLITPSRTVSPKKIKQYTKRLHASLSASKRRLSLQFNDINPSKSKQHSASANDLHIKSWRPTGALVVRDHPEEKALSENLPCNKCLILGRGIAFQKQDNDKNIPACKHRKISRTTVASTVRLNQLSKSKPHPWWTAPPETEYKSISPQKFYSSSLLSTLESRSRAKETPSVWKILRDEQEANGLSEASMNLKKITHPVLLYKAQQKYSERINIHLESDHLLDNMKLPPLSDTKKDFIRY